MQRFLVILLCAICLAACGQPAAQSTPSAENAIVPQLAFSEAVVGTNRVALVLVRNNTPLNDPNIKVDMRFAKLEGSEAPVSHKDSARYYGEGLPVGFYVTYPTFDSAGKWVVEVSSQMPNESTVSTSQLVIDVKAKSIAPNVGEKSKSFATPTLADTPAEQISSGQPINPALYQISLDDALASGKPTAILFGTPAFCASATCGPSLKVLDGLQAEYGEQINFIHVEVYAYPFSESAAKGVLSEGMKAWGIPTEPWLYLIDANGVIAARVEGGITHDEIAPALAQLAAGQPVVLGQ
jgi:hypothetical protein